MLISARAWQGNFSSANACRHMISQDHQTAPHIDQSVLRAAKALAWQDNVSSANACRQIISQVHQTAPHIDQSVLRDQVYWAVQLCCPKYERKRRHFRCASCGGFRSTVNVLIFAVYLMPFGGIHEQVAQPLSFACDAPVHVVTTADIHELGPQPPSFSYDNPIHVESDASLLGRPLSDFKHQQLNC